jgi:branched-chain amino acid aminotransferase
MIAEPGTETAVWLDGEFVAWRDAKMHVADHHFGFGVFEGVRSYAGQVGTVVFRLEDHTARLFRSAHILNLAIPAAFDQKRLNEAQLELLRKNRFADAYLRPFVFCSGAQGLSPHAKNLPVHVAVIALEWKSPPAQVTPRRGLVLRTASYTRHSNSQLFRAKANGNYLTGMLALADARASNADDVLILDQNGFATETSGANLFVVRERELCTPPLACVLEGITRDTVITLASKLGLKVVERNLTREDIYTGSEAFVTGTALEVAAVAELDGRRIGQNSAEAPGPITSRLQSMYAAYVRGRGEDHHEWLRLT